MDNNLEKLIECKSFAIFGGTFDPVHKGHTDTAMAILELTGTEKLLLVPLGNPPHKNEKNVTDAKHRLNMLETVFSYDDRFVISDIEIKREGKTYTIDTIRELREKLGNDKEFFFCMGADALHDIYTWKDFKELLKICSFLVVTRPGYNNIELEKDVKNLTEQYGANIKLVEIPPVEISSSQLRQMLKNNEDTSKFIDEKVLEYINKNGLYKYKE